jgi:carboxylate-amine ligase
VEFLRQRQVIEQVNDLWWDVRPSPGYGTVEIRICDLPSRFSETLGLTAIIQALVAFIAETPTPYSPVSLQLLRSNKWQAVRHGLDGRFNDAFGLLNRQTQTLRQAAENLLGLIQPFIHRFQTSDQVDVIREVLQYGTSTDRQRALIARGMTFKEMITRLRDDYWQEHTLDHEYKI